MNDEFRGHSPLPNESEIAWMSVRPLAALRRVALLALLAFAVAMALAPASDPVTPIEVGVQRTPPGQREVDAHGGVLAQAPNCAGARFSALRPLV